MLAEAWAPRGGVTISYLAHSFSAGKRDFMHRKFVRVIREGHILIRDSRTGL